MLVGNVTCPIWVGPVSAASVKPAKMITNKQTMMGTNHRLSYGGSKGYACDVSGSAWWMKRNSVDRSSAAATISLTEFDFGRKIAAKMAKTNVTKVGQ
jgi:hypothetical protein